MIGVVVEGQPRVVLDLQARRLHRLDRARCARRAAQAHAEPAAATSASCRPDRASARCSSSPASTTRCRSPRRVEDGPRRERPGPELTGGADDRPRRSRPAATTSPSCDASSRAAASVDDVAVRPAHRRPQPRRVRGLRQRHRRPALRGLRGRPSRWRSSSTGRGVAVTVHDHAGGFAPDEVDPLPDADDPGRLRHERGLGLPLMREPRRVRDLHADRGRDGRAARGRRPVR